MDGKPVKTKVVINGITIKDDSSTENYLIDWSRNDTLDGDAIKTITINCPRNIENILTLTDANLIGNDKEVVITRGIATSTEEIVFRGVVKQYNVFGGVVSFVCADKLYISTKNKINYSYDKDIDPSAGVISEIFLDMINTYTPLTADATSVQSSGSILIRDKVICKSDSVYDKIMSELATPLNWNVYYDSITDKVNFEPKGFTNNSTTLQTGVNILNSLNWKSDESNIFNYIEVQGAEQEIQTIENGQIGITSGYTTSSIQLNQIPNTVRVLCDSSNPPTTEKIGGVVNSTSTYDYSVDTTKKQIIWNTDTFTPGASDYVIIEYSFNRPTPIVVSDPVSISSYGQKDLTIIKNDIKTVSDARLYANALLSEYKNPIISTTIRATDVSDFRPGQKVRVIDNINNIDNFFYVTKLKQSYPYMYDELEVTSEILDVDDGFFVFIIRKLMQLDRQTKDDFNFLIQVQSFTNESIYENRYVKILKTSIEGTTGIYDSPAFGIWDTATYEDTSVGSFILGHPTWGKLGTAQLGSGSRQDVYVFMENTEKRYVELFYDTEFEASGSGDWDTTNQYLELEDTEDSISELICYDLENTDTNCYKSVNISITGTGLNELDFYIGEYDGTTTTYTLASLVGSSSSKTATINLSNSNFRGLRWKAEADGGTVIISRLIITYIK